MVHYSCDRCGRMLSGNRYVVNLEVTPAPDNLQLTDEDLDADHLDQVAELLESLDLDEAEAGLDPLSSHSKQFDLCPTCRELLLLDPLGTRGTRQLKFSGN